MGDFKVMETTKFNPQKCGLTQDPEEDGDHLYIQNNKVVLRLRHFNYFQGIDIEWSIYKVIHCYDGSTKESIVFSGKIPTNEFWEQLFKNVYGDIHIKKPL